MKKTLLLFIAIAAIGMQAIAQCAPGQAQIKVVLKTDTYPNETNWKLFDANNVMITQSANNLTASTLYKDSICVPANACYHFKITDAGNDGICCTYGSGFYEVYYNNVLVKADSNFGSQSNAYLGCPPGGNCDQAIGINPGTHVAPAPNTWYSFTPPTTGMYTVSTCAQGNTCDTKLWMYDYCTNLIFDSTNVATIYYATHNCGGNQAQINAYMLSTHTYYIRVGDANSSCTNTPITWSVNYNGIVSGCTDTAACNFNPFATVSIPSSCYYYPSAQCPTGSDLLLDSARLSNTIQMDTLTIDLQNNNHHCLVNEGCLNGYGLRELVRFDTKISNIGATDFYAGTPPSSFNAYSPIYEYDQCHGHWHFNNYAEYLLADSMNNFIPIGYKNGFCVLDLTCTTGTGKFGCNNMGITAGCADIYGAYLDCQWIDITDVADGNYKLIVRANWVPRPDFYGRYETSYTNNWARSCVTISHDATGKRQVVVTPNCAPYVDCNGIVNGLSLKDCDGTCGGSRLTGDLNVDSLRNNTDLTNYLLGSIYHSLPASKCTDLNDDQKINIVDAALLFECAKHGGGVIPTGHTHEPCQFPNKIKNPQQHADFSIGNIDYIAKTIDIFIKNETAKVMGYQLKLKGVSIQSVQNAIPGYLPTIYSRPSGEIIVLSSDEVPIPKNNVTTLALRIKYASINANQVCIDSILGVVNEAFEEVNHNLVDSFCIHAIPTPNSIADVKGNKGFTVYPNPFTDVTTLLLNETPASKFDVIMFDVYGRKVRSYLNQSGKILLIEKGALSSGIYFLQLKGNDWEAKEKLIIE